MSVVTALLSLLSCSLIAAGVWLVLRDVRATQKAGGGRITSVSMGGLVRRAAAQPEGILGWKAVVRKPSAPGPAASDKTSAARQIVGREPRGVTPPPWGDEPRAVADPVLAAALRAVSSAFAEAGVSLSARGGDDPGRPAGGALQLAVLASGRNCGLLSLKRAAAGYEIEARSGDGTPAGFAAPARVMSEDANIQALASAIAAAAWPLARRTLRQTPRDLPA
jgi:hypothetical protein